MPSYVLGGQVAAVTSERFMTAAERRRRLLDQLALKAPDPLLALASPDPDTALLPVPPATSRPLQDKRPATAPHCKTLSPVLLQRDEVSASGTHSSAPVAGCARTPHPPQRTPIQSPSAVSPSVTVSANSALQGTGCASSHPWTADVQSGFASEDERFCGPAAEQPDLFVPSERKSPPEMKRPSSAQLREAVAQQQTAGNPAAAYDDQVQQYASDVLGMDLESDDAYLLWIAREGLAAPIPDGWHWSRAPCGGVYYIHGATRQTQWDHPADAAYQTLFLRRRTMLAPVLAELRRLDAVGWLLHVPGLLGAPPLHAATFVDSRTLLRRQRSQENTVSDSVRCRAEDLPAVSLSRLLQCNVSPARPGIVDLGVGWAGSIGVHLWLEVLWDGVTLSITFREHLLPRQTRAGPNAASPRSDEDSR